MGSQRVGPSAGAELATSEFGPRKTVLILAIVAGCFAVLWPKILWPMLAASVAPLPHAADGSGCCDVMFESDATAADIMRELCRNIMSHHQVDPRLRGAIGADALGKLGPSGESLCRDEVLARCGIDLGSFLASNGRSNKSYRQVLDEIRGFNGSWCLKSQFGVPPARLGTPHLIRYHILMPHSTIRQERQTPPHAGSYHPALRERGRAIPSSHIVPKIQDRADHIPPIKMRPPLGGGHVVSVPKGNGSLGLLMPLYTIGIVIFFLYTISKVLMRIFMPIYTIGNVLSLLYKALQVLRKSSDSEIIKPEYSTAAAEREYQKIVFNPEIFAAAVTAVNGVPYEQEERPLTPAEEPVPTIDELNQQAAGDIEIDQLRRRLIETEAAMERIVVQMSNLSRSVMNCSTPPTETKEMSSLDESLDENVEVDKELEEYHETSPTVKVVNMEMTASCEGGQMRSRPTTPVLLTPVGHAEEKEKSPPISIYLEGALPPQCELLVTDSKIQEIQEEENLELPIILSGKMTLSLISLDQEFSENEHPETKATSRPILRSNVSDDNSGIESEYAQREIKMKNDRLDRIGKDGTPRECDRIYSHNGHVHQDEDGATEESDVDEDDEYTNEDDEDSYGSNDEDVEEEPDKLRQNEKVLQHYEKEGRESDYEGEDEEENEFNDDESGEEDEETDEEDNDESGEDDEENDDGDDGDDVDNVDVEYENGSNQEDETEEEGDDEEEESEGDIENDEESCDDQSVDDGSDHNNEKDTQVKSHPVVQRHEKK